MLAEEVYSDLTGLGGAEKFKSEIARNFDLAKAYQIDQNILHLANPRGTKAIEEAASSNFLIHDRSSPWQAPTSGFFSQQKEFMQT